MARKYPALNALCGWNRFCGVLAGVAGVTTAFILLSGGDLLTAGGCVVAGVSGFLGFTAVAEMIEMAISAREDLSDVRFYLSSMSMSSPSKTISEQERSETGE